MTNIVRMLHTLSTFCSTDHFLACIHREGKFSVINHPLESGLCDMGLGSAVCKV